MRSTGRTAPYTGILEVRAARARPHSWLIAIKFAFLCVIFSVELLVKENLGEPNPQNKKFYPSVS
jgi:hypothetical protein